MRKDQLRSIGRKLLSIMLFSIVLFALGLITAAILSNKTGQKMYDILTYEGLLLIIIGIFLAMKGNPSGINLNGMGSKNAQGISYLNQEVTRLERETQPYHKGYLKNNIIQFRSYHAVIIVSGLLMIAACLIMIYWG